MGSMSKENRNMSRATIGSRGIRGGIMQSVHRWAVANNPYMGSEYGPKIPTKYLQYLDANNLYGWSMSLQEDSTGVTFSQTKLAN